MSRYRLAVSTALALLAAVHGRSAWGLDQSLIGFRALVVDPKPTDASKRKVKFDVREGQSSNTLEGDPSVTGGVLRIVVDGTTPSSQTLCLPPAGWTPTQNGFRYMGGALDAVKLFKLRRTPRETPQGLLRMFGFLRGRFGPVDIVPPNTLGSQGMTVTFTIGEALGACTADTPQRYCTAFGGAAGGTIIVDDVKRLRVRFPSAEPACPPGSPSGAFLEENGL